MRPWGGIVPRRTPAPVLLAIVFALVGCGRDGFPGTPVEEPPAYDLTGRYAGSLELEGGVVDAFLQLSQEEGRLTGTLTSSIGLDADARGVLDGVRLLVVFDYDEECDGEGRMEGRALDGGRRLLGRFIAEDCTGRVEGGFSFTRSSGERGSARRSPVRHGPIDGLLAEGLAFGPVARPDRARP